MPCTFKEPLTQGSAGVFQLRIRKTLAHLASVVLAVAGACAGKAPPQSLQRPMTTGLTATA